MNAGTEPTTSPETSGSPFLALLMCLFVIAVGALAIYSQRPPAVVPADAPPADFSAGRAVRHLQPISGAARPTGSAAHAAVRDYILRSLRDLGLAPEIQQTTVARTLRARAVAAGVQNISARLRGTQNSRAILLVAHYDSVPNSYGAGDNASGVCVLLETLRALKAGAPLKNDVVFLFTDAEEFGLLGAQAYVDEAAAAQNIGLVLNFDARGSSGPVYMFQTGENNGRLVDEFRRAAPRPFASSLMHTIYKLLPNETDFTPFSRAGLPGLNFAFIGDVSRYHTPRDTPDLLDERAVQHEGSYALALTRHFGDLNLEDIKAPDAVYFDVLGAKLFNYPGAWLVPLMILLSLLFVAVVWRGRRARVTLTGVVAGFFVFLLSFVVSVAAAVLVSFVIGRLQRITPFSNAHLYTAGYAALALAVATALVLAFGRRSSLANASAGALLLWLLCTVLTGLLLPGASYLFMWPLLFGLAALAVMTFARGTSSWLRFTLLCACALPCVVLIVGTVYTLLAGVGTALLPITVGPLVLLMGLLIPHLEFINARRRWLLPAAALVAGLIFLAAAVLTPAFGHSQPRTDTLFYSLDADSGEAVWASPDPRPDEWTTQFFQQAAEQSKAANHFPNSPARFTLGVAPALNLAAAEVRVLSDEAGADSRRLRLHIASPGGARVLNVFVEPGAEVLSAAVNNKRVEARAAAPGDAAQAVWELSYIGVPEGGIELSLEVKASAQLKLRVVSQTDGLPQAAFASKPRPDYLVPSAFGDATRVIKSFSLPPAG